MAHQKLHSCGSQPRRRRAHHKSKQGCHECKARHIKCDESRPCCINCVTSERQCSFAELSQSSSAPTASPIHRQASNETALVPLAPVQFSVVHLTCLHHAEHQMEEYMALHESAQPIIEIAINNATVAPFLLDQVLALSAMHLSTKDVSMTSFYHHQATELQTRALESFNQGQEMTSTANCVPVFLFASLLGTHSLRETLANHLSSLPVFVEAFIRYLHLHRGVRTFITEESWAHILNSDLKPLLFLSDISNKLEKHAQGAETARLKEFLESYELSSESLGACQEALEWMQWVFDLCKQDQDDEYLGIHAVLAWPLVVPDKYVEALHQRRPEAFAVLAFYAAALHRYRQFWIFGGAGASLLRLIYASIGSFWLAHLDLPRGECHDL